MNPDELFDSFRDPNAGFLARTLYRFFHLIDDLVDRDKEVPAADVACILLALFDQLSNNPFWLLHKNDLMPVVFSSAMAWAASERLRKSENVQDRLAAEVLKSQYQDIFFRIAFLDGGVSFSLESDAKFRGFAFG